MHGAQQAVAVGQMVCDGGCVRHVGVQVARMREVLLHKKDTNLKRIPPIFLQGQPTDWPDLMTRTSPIIQVHNESDLAWGTNPAASRNRYAATGIATEADLQPRKHQLVVPKVRQGIVEAFAAAAARPSARAWAGRSLQQMEIVEGVTPPAQPLSCKVSICLHEPCRCVQMCLQWCQDY